MPWHPGCDRIGFNTVIGAVGVSYRRGQLSQLNWDDAVHMGDPSHGPCMGAGDLARALL